MRGDHDHRYKKGQSGNPAGRPKGGLQKRSREIAERAVKDGITPLEVIIKVMREQWAIYEAEREKPDTERDPQALAGYASTAVLAAEKAAPYLHPRLAAVEHTGEVTHNYVARVPHVSENAEEWTKQHAPTMQ